MSEKQRMAESHKRGKEKRKWPKAKEKKRKKNNKAKGLSKEKKRKKAQSVLVCQRHKIEKEKRDVACFVRIDFIVLHAYVVITCSYYWSLTTFHHSPFIISLPFNP